MEGGVDKAIVDCWQLRRLVREDGRPGNGRSLAEEDNDEYHWRMDDPPDDVIAAVTHLDERREKTAELSALCEDDHTQHECAAGALCAAPPGTNGSASAHRCLDCRGKIHCAMWCGKNWGEYIKSDRCKTDRLEIPSPFSSESNGLHTEAPTATAAASTIDPVATCAWDAVILSTLATNMAQKEKLSEPLKPSNSTRLQGFCIKGVLLPTTKVTRDSLMKWAIG
jgi:hypothetical protein